MGHKGRGGSAATPRSRWPGGGGSGGGGGGGGGSSGDGFASRKDAFMTSKVMDVIADFQAALDQLPPDPRRPLASAQRRWDPDAILQHCKQQARHADLRRQQHRALLRWIADAVAIMKQMERDELDGANDDVPDLVRLSGDGAGAHHDDGEASTRIGTSVDEDEDDEDDDEQSSEDLDALEDVPMMVVKDSNIMNQSLLSMYESRRPPAAPAAAPASSAPQQSPAPAAKDTASQNNHAVTPADNGAPELAARETRVAEAEERIRKMREANGTSKRRRNRAADQPAKRSKTDAIADKYAPPDKRLSDLGGIDHCIEEVLQLIGMPLRYPEIYTHLGIQPPRGILLHGPPGCGKTMMAHAIAGEAGVPFISISAPSVVSGMSGESEKKIREVFEEAKEHAPCILFIDEIDAITPKRETAQREMERRIVAQLLTCMDDITPDRADFKPILVIGATNRPDSLDPALRRAGRFDREISMGVPDESARVKILEKICSKIRLSGDFDFVQLAKLTPGFVGADLQALTSEAGLVAVRRIFQSLVASQTSALSAAAETGDDSGSVEMQVDAPPVPAPAPPLARDFGAMLKADPHIVTQFLSDRSRALTGLELDGLAIRNDDFLAALGKVQPSSKREGFLTRADVTWADVGALAGVREELRMAVVEPIRHPDVFRAVGIVRPCGVLLHGPPGCGKTMLAKAVASECCCNFISVRGPELLNKYVGESERAVRLVFARAAASAPCVIFFDEIDALCPARSNDPENHSAARLVNTLLTEMDGMSPRSQVYVLAATNRPDLLDAALLRPGRLDKALYVDLPDADGRAAILAAAARSTQSPLAADVDLRAVAADTRADGCSGADLAALLRDAAVAALRRSLHVLRALGDLDDPDARMARSAAVDGGGGGDALPPVAVCAADFDAALARLVPSVSRRDRRRYELLRDKFSSDPLAPVPVPVPATADDPGVGVARPRPSSLKS